MTPRRMGRGPAMLGIAGVVGLLAAACEDGTYDYVRVCGTVAEPVVRVDDRYCEDAPSRGEADRHGWYFQQLPATWYDEDGVGYADEVLIVAVGQPIVLPQGTSPRAARTPPARVAPARIGAGTAAAPKGGGTISRGGLGGTSSGSSGS